MKDWLGQDYGPGDLVLYAAMSGRSVTCVLAKVIEIRKVFRNEAFGWQQIGFDEEFPMHTVWRSGEQLEEPRQTDFRVKVLPLKSSRWQQHYGQDIYTDKRTGKRIKKPFGEEHWCGYDGSPNAPFKEHVEKTNVQRPVTLTVTENIVKWSGEVSEDA